MLNMPAKFAAFQNYRNGTFQTAIRDLCRQTEKPGAGAPGF
jgi:hypothetical protein